VVNRKDELLWAEAGRVHDRWTIFQAWRFLLEKMQMMTKKVKDRQKEASCWLLLVLRVSYT
jgi:hypothetical protein